MMEWEYSRAAFEDALLGTGFQTRKAGKELAGLADDRGYIEREDVPRRASMAAHIGALRELRLVEVLPAGRLRLTMNASPVTVRKAAA